ncbi:MAG: hypothetical protein R3C46_04075 [Hyphomonadaceae bacterium]
MRRGSTGMNVGTIIEEPMVSVRLVSFVTSSKTAAAAAGRKLGEMEEYFFEMLTPGDTFLFSGEILRFEGMSDTDALVTKTFDSNPKIPSYTGGKFPLTTFSRRACARCCTIATGGAIRRRRCANGSRWSVSR